VRELALEAHRATIPASVNGLPQRPLGRTGVNVSLMCLGGWHIGAGKISRPDEAEAIRMMHTAIDEGVNFFDNAWDYHDGYAEELMGKALAMDGKRQKVFLMTKDCERDYDGSMRCLEDSLRRLQTDHLDLWQFHELVYDNDPDWIFERGGIRAAIEAQQAGKVRFIGFTGHKDPRIHLRMLAKPHVFDASLMPISAMDVLYRSFVGDVAPVCVEKGTGVIGMKALGGGYPEGVFVEKAGLDAAECYRFALTMPVASQVMGMKSMDELKKNIETVRNFVPMTDEEQEALLAKVRPVATDGRFERFKSTVEFDGPHHKKQHGFAVAAAS
jgi:aryl-alcohol dehydrogenase-like predicted oxidoreductase